MLKRIIPMPNKRLPRSLMVSVAFFLLTFSNAGLPAYGGEGELSELISLARSHLGDENTLKGVRALRIQAKIYGDSDAQGSITMTLEKPLKQRIDLVSDGIRETTATNGYEGYVRIEEIETERWRLKVLQSDEVEKALIVTWENLNFFSHPKKRFGQIERGESRVVDGVRCHSLIYSYPNGMVFERFIDARTGNLVLTIDQDGVRTSESGDQFSGGIRFPKEVERKKEGKRVSRILLERIDVNPDVPDGFFDFPAR